MLRVLHCIYDDLHNRWVAGGGSVRVFEIYRRLTREVAVTVASGNYPGARDEVVDGVEYIRIGAPSPYAWSRWSYAREATRLLRRRAYDVGVFDFSVYTPIRVPRNRPIGVTVHHLTGPSAPARWGGTLGAAVRLAERRLLRRARWFSSPSVFTLDQLRSIVPADARLMLVGNGVGDELFQVDRDEQDYLLFFGRLDLFQKGLDTLLRAMARLVSQKPGLRLIVAGRGRDAETVGSLAKQLGIAANVRLIRDVSAAQRLQLFAGARLLLMPSRFEGFGMVAAEAMAAGVLVVAAAAGALPEVVGPDGGILVRPNDAAALATAVAALLDDPDRRAELGRGARRRARRFSWDRVAREHLCFLRSIEAGTRRHSFCETGT